MQYKIAQVIGLNSDQEAAQVISSSKEGKDLFIGALQIVCDDAFTRGRQILNESMDLYFEADGTVASKLTSAFGQLKTKLGDIDHPNILLAAVSGKVLYVLREGEFAVYLKRGEKISSLLTVAQSNQLISGFLQEGDRVLVATISLSNLLGDDLKGSLNVGLNEWEEDVTIRISTSSLESQGLAGLLLDSQSEQEAKKPKQSNDYIPETEAKSKIGFGGILGKLRIPFFRKAKSDNSTDVIDSEDKPEETINKRKIRLSALFPQSGRIRLVLGICLIAVTIGGVAFQYKKNQDLEKSKAFNQLITQAKEELSAAEGLKTLNPNEAKSKLESAKTMVDKALAIQPTAAEGLTLKKTIAENGDKILQQFAASSFPIFLDLDLVKTGLNAKQLSLSDGNILTLDPTSKTLISINTEKKSTKILAGEQQLGNGIFASINDSFAFVYSADKGIVKVDITNQKATNIAKTDKALTKVADIAGFASNIYLLEQTDNMIWKYIATSTGYADKREYFAKSVKADLAGSVRMQIESSIYVLKEGGEILRFTKGAADTFSYSGLDKPISSPKSFYVSSDTESLYILDSGNSRLVVLDKKGVYKAQYQGDKFATATDLVVDEKGKKVYLLDGSKIYQTDLK